jgi:4-hydroxybenzoate polyprenyltransferase
MLERTLTYGGLIRFPYHLSFIVVLLGMLTATRELTRDLLVSAGALYISFNVLLCGGIYTLHAITDASLDRLHPRKRLRPIPSKVISIRNAMVFGTALMVGGILTGYALFPTAVVRLYIAAVLLNAVYSFFARAVPYLEIAVNAATYPVRFQMGAILGGGDAGWPLLLLTFLVAAGGATLRRRLELARGGIDARPALGAYSSRTLLAIEIGLWVAIGALRLADSSTPHLYYLVAASAHAVLVLVPEIHPPFRVRWERLWSV